MIERECGDGICGVAADARKRAKIVDLARQRAAMFTDHDFCESVQIARPGVVTQPLPAVENAGARRKRESGEIGEAAQPLIIIREDSGDLGLLKHELGNEDRVGIAGAAPGKVAPVRAVPAHEKTTEAADVLWRGQAEANVQRSTLNVQRRMQKIIER